MAHDAYYSDPSVTLMLARGATAVTSDTGLFAIWAKPGDHLMLDGLAVVIASVESNIAFTLAQPWPGPDTESATGWLVDRGPGWGRNVPIHTDVVDILQRIRSGIPFRPDAVGSLEDRTGYDEVDPGFIFQRIDVLPFELYVKSGPGAEWAGPEILQGPRGLTGYNGWSPIWALIDDGARRLLQISGWQGGEGNRPPVGAWLGAAGLVETMAEATDIRGPIGDVTPEVRALAAQAEEQAGLAGGSAASAAGSASAAAGSAQDAAASAATISPNTYVSRANNGADFDNPLTVLQNLKGGATGIDLFKAVNGSAAKAVLGAIGNDDLATMAAGTVKGRMAGAGVPEDLAAAQVWGLIGPAGKATKAQAETGTDDAQFITSARLRGAQGKWLLQKIKLSASTAAIVQSIPAEVEQLFISGRFFGQNPASLLLQLSTDGGQSYANSYAYAYIVTIGSTIMAGNAPMSGFNLGNYNYNDPSWSTPFSSEIQLADIGKRPLLLTKSMQWASDYPQLVTVVGWGVPITARATHLRIFASTGSLMAGTSISIWGA